MRSPEQFLIDLACQVDPAATFRTAVGSDADPWQIELLNAPASETFIQVLASRGTGKSICAAVKAYAFAEAHPAVTVLIIAPSLRQSTELFNYVEKVRLSLPMPMPVTRSTQSELHLANQSRIIVLPGNADTARGYRCHLLIFEEAARVTDDVFQALTPSVLGKGQIVAITTPAGRVGWFPDLWFQGLGLRIIARSTDLPRLADVVARDRKIMREGQFRQEHLLEFAGSGETFFDYEMLQRALCDAAPLELGLW